MIKKKKKKLCNCYSTCKSYVLASLVSLALISMIGKNPLDTVFLSAPLTINCYILSRYKYPKSLVFDIQNPNLIAKKKKKRLNPVLCVF